MQATIHSGFNNIRRHLTNGATVLGVLMVAVTIFSITALVLLLRPTTQPAVAAIEASAQPALSEQQIAEWTEIYVTQLAEQRPVLPSRPAGLAALDIASQDVLKAQRIAEWTEYNVTQTAETVMSADLEAQDNPAGTASCLERLYIQQQLEQDMCEGSCGR